MTLTVDQVSKAPLAPDIRLWRHQQALLVAPSAWPNVELFFLVAGYGSGKSYAGAMLILNIAHRYDGYEVVVGVGGDTMKRLNQTLLMDLFRLCNLFGIAYSEQAQQGTFRIGTVLFVKVPLNNPGLIYGHNFSIFIGDEIDELPQEKAMETFKAIQERTRVRLPDGREPFSVFMTTAQGYRGTYQIVNELDDKEIPYILIHGKTKDNLALTPRYVARLYSLYNEVERLVYLEGAFANLTTGRVYYDYDEKASKLVVAPFEILPSDIIHVGQDLNSGFSRGTAVVMRDNILYAVKSWSFGEIGHAPKMIRNDFPVNEIRWYPDATGKEIMAGYVKEIHDAGIALWMGTINPSIVDRIFFVNKLFKTGRAFLFPGCKELSMALKVRQFNDHGDPEKGKGPEAPDHHCDGFEYVIWRMVMANVAFRDLVQATRAGRAEMQKAAA